MKALFVHDHPFVEIDNVIYTTSSLNIDIWKRYLKYFDELIVVGRKSKSQSTKGLTLSSYENVHFYFIDEYINPRSLLFSHRKIKLKLLSIVKGVDFAIIRLPSMLGLITTRIAKRKALPYLIESVGCAWDSVINYGTLSSIFLAPIIYFLNKRVIKHSCFVHYVTQHFLQNRYPTRGISSAISDVNIQMVSKDVLVHRLQKINSIDIQNSGFVFGMIGNINVKYKGYDVAFHALSSIKEKGMTFKIILVGGGDDRYVASLANKYGINKELEIRGKIKSGRPIFEFLDSIDIYLQPSKQEGLPRSVIEAMSRGCPILASNAGGIPELVNDAWIHKKGSWRDLEEQITRLYEDNKQVISNMALENFENAKKYEDQYLDKLRDDFWFRVMNSITEKW